MSEAEPDTSRDSLAALLARVQENRESRCRELLRQAREDAESEVREAYRRNRAELHRAIQQERDRMEERLRSRHAHLETQRRLQRHRRVNDILEQGFERLERTLRQRWEESAARAEWVAAAMSQARDFLTAGHWILEHPPGWDPDEAPDPPEGITLEARADDDLRTGLRIRAGNARVDATPGGLLRDSERVKSWLLAEIQALQRQEEGG
jgi:stress-induced morphogen